MTPLTRTAERLAGVTKMLVKDPGQMRYLPKWARALRRPTLESRMAWLPFRVISVLEQHLGPTSRVFEYGGGGSTVWFADRAGMVVTVEHDDDWFPILRDAVANLDQVAVLHRTAEGNYGGYVGAIDDFDDDSFDVVVVDGRERVRCLREAMPKVRPGGLLILDDSDRPRYAEAHVAAATWPSRTYSGLTPSKAIAGTSTVWTKPSSER